MTVSAVVISHGNKEAISKMVYDLRHQTKPPDEIILAVCCVDSLDDIPADIRLLDKHRDDVGQSKCDFGLRMATQDYVGFFSSDDEYDPAYIEELSKLDADILHCHFKSHLVGEVISPKPVVGEITRGSFLVRREFAIKAGGYDNWTYSGDGAFIMKLVQKGATDAVVPKMLYKHN